MPADDTVAGATTSLAPAAQPVPLGAIAIAEITADRSADSAPDPQPAQQPARPLGTPSAPLTVPPSPAGPAGRGVPDLPIVLAPLPAAAAVVAAWWLVVADPFGWRSALVLSRLERPG